MNLILPGAVEVEELRACAGVAVIRFRACRRCVSWRNKYTSRALPCFSLITKNDWLSSSTSRW